MKLMFDLLSFFSLTFPVCTLLFVKPAIFILVLCSINCGNLSRFFHALPDGYIWYSFVLVCVWVTWEWWKCIIWTVGSFFFWPFYLHPIILIFECLVLVTTGICLFRGKFFYGDLLSRFCELLLFSVAIKWINQPCKLVQPLCDEDAEILVDRYGLIDCLRFESSVAPWNYSQYRELIN